MLSRVPYTFYKDFPVVVKVSRKFRTKMAKRIIPNTTHTIEFNWQLMLSTIDKLSHEKILRVKHMGDIIEYLLKFRSDLKKEEKEKEEEEKESTGSNSDYDLTNDDSKGTNSPDYDLSDDSNSVKKKEDLEMLPMSLSPPNRSPVSSNKTIDYQDDNSEETDTGLNTTSSSGGSDYENPIFTQLLKDFMDGKEGRSLTEPEIIALCDEVENLLHNGTDDEKLHLLDLFILQNYRFKMCKTTSKSEIEVSKKRKIM